MQQISKIKDEDILIMLEEELSYRLQSKTDITDELTPDQLSELMALASDLSDKDAVSLDAYRQATKRGRTK